MTIRECYAQIGSDFDKVLGRLGSESMVQRFARKFPADPSFSELETALREQNAEDAFRAAHTMKGICLNLGFERLYEVSNALTEKLRGRELVDYEELYTQLQEEYHRTVDAITQVEG